MNLLLYIEKAVKAIRWIILGFIFVLPILACEKEAVDRTEIKKQDLSDSDFAFKSCYQCDFSGKAMQRVDFRGADLQAATFDGADLRDADLSSAWLKRADFTNADLRGAKLDLICGIEEITWTDAKLDEKWATVVYLFTENKTQPVKWQGYDLSYVCFRGTGWTNADFQNAILEKSDFSGLDLDNANFQNTNLKRAYFGQSTLRGANFTGSDLTEADFSYASLTNAVVTWEQLKTAKLACTRMPDGIMFEEDQCFGDEPVP